MNWFLIFAAFAVIYGLVTLVLAYIVYVWWLMDARKISTAEVMGEQAEEDG